MPYKSSFFFLVELRNIIATGKNTEKFKSDLLYVCVSPKVVVKRIRTFLTFCVRYTGALSDCQYTMKHCGTDIVKHLPTSKYEWVEIDSNLCKAFANSKFVLSTLADMRKELAELGLKRLLGFCELLLVCNLKSTKPRDFVCACSFLLSLVKITEERLSVPRPRVVLKRNRRTRSCRKNWKDYLGRKKVIYEPL
uniref:Uncharacterized protein n=1 Tax=Wuchereria bancrofti TaxID=6293 RepID=A0AAF5RU38_WUCBA